MFLQFQKYKDPGDEYAKQMAEHNRQGRYPAIYVNSEARITVEGQEVRLPRPQPTRETEDLLLDLEIVSHFKPYRDCYNRPVMVAHLKGENDDSEVYLANTLAEIQEAISAAKQKQGNLLLIAVREILRQQTRQNAALASISQKLIDPETDNGALEGMIELLEVSYEFGGTINKIMRSMDDLETP